MKIKVITTEIKWISWEELKVLSEAGKLGEVLKSGDNIPVTLKNGEEVSFDIGKDESGKIYFIMHNCLKETKPMNKGWTNKGGWEESAMRKYLNEEVIELLPDGLKKVIKPTKIVQVWDGKRRETEDKLFLLSKTQVFGKDTNYEAIEPEDSQIDIFGTERSRVKEREGYGTAWWWERSPSIYNGSYFRTVNSNGNSSGSNANHSSGVAPAFCI
nr:MAG TPA: hypothetical protein [Caudoviricetes sp.]